MADIRNTTAYGMRLQFRGANAEDWASDYVLLAGEVGFELDTKKYKLGDGTTAWSSLAYYTEPTISAAVDALTSRVTTAESDITGLKGRMDTAESNISALQGITVISGNPAPAA